LRLGGDDYGCVRGELLGGIPEFEFTEETLLFGGHGFRVPYSHLCCCSGAFGGLTGFFGQDGTVAGGLGVALGYGSGDTILGTRRSTRGFGKRLWRGTGAPLAVRLETLGDFEAKIRSGALAGFERCVDLDKIQLCRPRCSQTENSLPSKIV
jgi:hypothetical protein